MFACSFINLLTIEGCFGSVFIDNVSVILTEVPVISFRGCEAVLDVEKLVTGAGKVWGDVASCQYLQCSDEYCISFVVAVLGRNEEY